MCNLLIPLCPFVLHSVTTSAERAKQFRRPSDARILFQYLSQCPNDHLQHRSRQEPSHAQGISLAQKSTKLYKRTTWHTCSCFFKRVAILHPMPGPSRPIFGMAYHHCKRCSGAAKTVRPMRMGGIGDKGDPYWNRCIFAGVRGVLENGFEDEDENIGRNMRFSSEDAHAIKVIRPPDFSGRYDGYQTHGQPLPVGKAEYDEQQARPHKDDCKIIHDRRSSDSTNMTYSEDLDRYLAETFSSKIRLNA